MRPKQVLLLCLTALALIVGGVLECGTAPLTEQQAHGAELYDRICSVCHGRGGEGYKADQATALRHRAFLGSVSDAYLSNAIRHGRMGTTMSAWGSGFGGPLSSDDVRSVIAFVRVWEHWPKPALDETPLKGDVHRGETTFAKECAGCHGKHGVGGPNVGIGNPALLEDATNGFLRYAIRDGRAGTAMPAFADKLKDQGVEDVVAYLRNLVPLPRPTSFDGPKPEPIPLGPVPLNPKGPEPLGFKPSPGTTPADVIKAQLDRGAKMAMLDARAPSDYTNGHIKGAVSVPFYAPEPYVDSLPRNAWLVCYCACPHAESGQLAQKLLAKGFTKVTVLDEGLGVWRSKGYPTAAGRDP
ncbi:MAG TPA: c-type cytochrome [Polyangiaceae bacterium]|nr:c-type cytochrome [Polyangiaceae bacterium]